MRFIFSNSSNDSALINLILLLIAKKISSSDLPTPSKIIISGYAPALKQRLSSPVETTSKPPPIEFINFIMA